MTEEETDNLVTLTESDFMRLLLKHETDVS